MKNKWGEELKPKKIKWHDQDITMPFNCAIYKDKEVKIQNRFGGEECTVPGYAASVYDTIIGAERFGEYNTMRLGLDWFAKHFPEQYMVLLDYPTTNATRSSASRIGCIACDLRAHPP